MFKTHVVDSKWNAWIVASKIRRQKNLRNFVLKILDLKPNIRLKNSFRTYQRKPLSSN